uniref:Uncharacterized protein n=1 Tax=Physcomitrium patens TaxID=3218 RepID=A0A2K1IUD5_PHYPA|nr:hypothetical protein PHYPA_024834 [Physcomitrium patens]
MPRQEESAMDSAAELVAGSQGQEESPYRDPPLTPFPFCGEQGGGGPGNMWWGGHQREGITTSESVPTAAPPRFLVDVSRRLSRGRPEIARVNALGDKLPRRVRKERPSGAQ